MGAISGKMTLDRAIDLSSPTNYCNEGVAGCCNQQYTITQSGSNYVYAFPNGMSLDCLQNILDTPGASNANVVDYNVTYFVVDGTQHSEHESNVNVPLGPFVNNIFANL